MDLKILKFSTSQVFFVNRYQMQELQRGSDAFQHWENELFEFKSMLQPTMVLSDREAVHVSGLAPI